MKTLRTALAHFVFNFTLVAQIFFGVAAISAANEVYATIGVGVAKSYQPSNSDGQYYQQRYGHDINVRDNSTSIGIGTRVSEHARAEITYYAPVVFDIFAGFVSDANYSANTVCNGSCDPTQYGHARETKEWLAATYLPEFRFGKSDSLYARIGVAYFVDKLEWRTTTDGTCDSCTYPTAQDLANRDRPTSRGFSPELGVGMKLGDIAIEWTRFNQIRVKAGTDIGPTDGVDVVRLVYMRAF